MTTTIVHYHEDFSICFLAHFTVPPVNPLLKMSAVYPSISLIAVLGFQYVETRISETSRWGYISNVRNRYRMQTITVHAENNSDGIFVPLQICSAGGISILCTLQVGHLGPQSVKETRFINIVDVLQTIVWRNVTYLLHSFFMIRWQCITPATMKTHWFVKIPSPYELLNVAVQWTII